MSGTIELIIGCMFAGKTTDLIRRLREAEAAGCMVHAFKHALDSARYNACNLATHAREGFPATPVCHAHEIAAQIDNAEVIGIDEPHFFGEPLVDVCAELVARGRRVIISGIDFDVWGRTFPVVDRLREIAADITVLTLPCTTCGAPARLNQRITPIIAGNLVGGPGDFEPRCAAHFTAVQLPAPEFPRG